MKLKPRIEILRDILEEIAEEISYSNTKLIYDFKYIGNSEYAYVLATDEDIDIEIGDVRDLEQALIDFVVEQIENFDLEDKWNLTEVCENMDEREFFQFTNPNLVGMK